MMIISICIICICVLSFTLGYEMGKRDYTDFWNNGRGGCT